MATNHCTYYIFMDDSASFEEFDIENANLNNEKSNIRII